jgi:hypothetical protein
MNLSASPSRISFRKSRTGILSLRQLSTTERIAATRGPACWLPIWMQEERIATVTADGGGRVLLRLQAFKERIVKTHSSKIEGQPNRSSLISCPRPSIMGLPEWLPNAAAKPPADASMREGLSSPLRFSLNRQEVSKSRNAVPSPESVGLISERRSVLHIAHSSSNGDELVSDCPNGGVHPKCLCPFLCPCSFKIGHNSGCMGSNQRFLNRA